MMYFGEHLPAIRFAINTTMCNATGYTPAYLLFGNEICHPQDAQIDLRRIAINENFHIEVQPFIKDLASKLEEAYEIGRTKEDAKPTVYTNFKDGDLVLLINHGLSMQRRT